MSRRTVWMQSQDRMSVASYTNCSQRHHLKSSNGCRMRHYQTASHWDTMSKLTKKQILLFVIHKHTSIVSLRPKTEAMSRLNCEAHRSRKRSRPFLKAKKRFHSGRSHVILQRSRQERRVIHKREKKGNRLKSIA